MLPRWVRLFLFIFCVLGALLLYLKPKPAPTNLDTLVQLHKDATYGCCRHID